MKKDLLVNSELEMQYYNWCQKYSNNNSDLYVDFNSDGKKGDKHRDKFSKRYESNGGIWINNIYTVAIHGNGLPISQIKTCPSDKQNPKWKLAAVGIIITLATGWYEVKFNPKEPK